MLRAPKPEPLVFTIIIAIIIVVLPDRVVLSDTDGDSYSDVRELVAGCNVWNAASFPTCQWGEVVACSTTEPGFTPPPEPC